MVIPYAAVNKDATWRGIGDRILPGKQLVCFFEENIKRVGTSPAPKFSLRLK
jgi:hypothetical protein